MVVAAKDEFIVLIKGTMAVVVHHQQDIVRGQLTELVESGGGAFDGPVHVDMVLGDLPAVVLEGFDQALALVFEGDVISCWRGHVILCSEVMKGPGENKAVDLFVLLSGGWESFTDTVIGLRHATGRFASFPCSPRHFTSGAVCVGFGQGGCARETHPLKAHPEVVFFREMMEIINGNVSAEMLGAILSTPVLPSAAMMSIPRILLHVRLVSRR